MAVKLPSKDSSPDPTNPETGVKYEELMTVEGSRRLLISKGTQSIFTQIISAEEWDEYKPIDKNSFVKAKIDDKTIYMKIDDITNSYLKISERELRLAAENNQLSPLFTLGFYAKDLYDNAITQKVEGLTLPLIRKVISQAKFHLAGIKDEKSIEFSKDEDRFITKRLAGRMHLIYLKPQDLLGIGSIGVVSKVYDITQAKFYAMKTARDSHSYYHLQIDKEARLLEEFSKRGLNGIQEAPLFKGTGFLVGKLYELGDLDLWNKKLSSSREKMDCCLQLWKQYVGFAQTPPNHFYHGDLKPANILVSRGIGKTEFRIGDWTDAQKSGEISGMLFCTPRFTPESYKKAIDLSKDFAMATKHDIFSLGATMYHALTGGKDPYTFEGYHIEPFKDKLLMEMGYPKELIDLIRSMVQLDPKNQLSFHDLNRGWELFEKNQNSSEIESKIQAS